MTSQTPSSPSQLLNLLQKAIASHVQYMSDAVDGRGVDRHLMGLKLLVEKNESMPLIFKDKAYDSTRHWNISTSQITSEFYEGWGWGEVVPDGFGIAYMIKEKSLHFNVTCLKHMDAPKLKYYVEEALIEMRDLVEAAQVNKAKL